MRLKRWVVVAIPGVFLLVGLAWAIVLVLQWGLGELDLERTPPAYQDQP